jgi:hypothetical protein
VDRKQDDFDASIGQLQSSLDTMINMIKHLAEKMMQFVSQ